MFLMADVAFAVTLTTWVPCDDRVKVWLKLPALHVVTFTAVPPSAEIVGIGEHEATLPAIGTDEFLVAKSAGGDVIASCVPDALIVRFSETEGPLPDAVN
jgi:hypothetical protein